MMPIGGGMPNLGAGALGGGLAGAGLGAGGGPAGIDCSLPTGQLPGCEMPSGYIPGCEMTGGGATQPGADPAALAALMQSMQGGALGG